MKRFCKPVLIFATLFSSIPSMATLTNGMPAAVVIGQSDFSSSSPNSFGSTTEADGARNLSHPFGASYDAINDLLFVSDDGNGRILVYDLSQGASNGLAAVRVIGDLSFGDLGTESSNEITADTSSASYSLAIGDGYLFAADALGGRVLVYDITGGLAVIVNGMQPFAVLGKDSFTGLRYRRTCSGAYAGQGATTSISDKCSIDPYTLAYSESISTLFVGDITGGRVLSYDLSGGFSSLLGMPPTNVIGKADFTSPPDPIVTQANLGLFPQALKVDDNANVLYVGDQHRVLVFDLSDGVTNGEPAINVLGTPDYTTPDQGQFATPSPTRNSFAGSTNGPFGNDGIASIEIDTNSGMLIVLDSANYRTLLFDLVESRTTVQPDALFVLGQPDFNTITPNTICGGGTAGVVNECGMDLYSSTTIDQFGNLFAADWLNSRVLVFDLSPTVSGIAGEIALENPDPNVIIRSEAVEDGTTNVTLKGFSAVDSIMINFPSGTESDNGIIVDSDSVSSINKGGIIISGVILPEGETKAVTITQKNVFRGAARVCIIDHATATFTTRKNVCLSAHQPEGTVAARYKIPDAGETVTYTIPAGGPVVDENGTPLSSVIIDPEHDVTLSTSSDDLSVTISGLLHSLIEFGPDQDEDDFDDIEDKCDNTRLDGDEVPSRRLKKNRMGDDVVIHGCNASQILACKPGRNANEKKFGLTPKTQDIFANQTGWAARCQYDNEEPRREPNRHSKASTRRFKFKRH
ncbi:MAG: hypothetical protein GY822_25915 [Deltaproteobacteria bacterium]|nr:hypothetical protein [Deltaproteobacteria bacterium]